MRTLATTALSRLNNKNSNHLSLFLLSSFIFVVTLHNTATIMWPGLDTSYALAFNYFFVADIQIGKDILFTYGPLGFLEWPQPQGNNLLYGHVTYTVIHFIFVSSLLWLGFNDPKPWNLLVVPILVLFISYLLPAFMYLKLVFGVGILLLLHLETRRVWILLLAMAFVVLALLIRSTYGIVSLIIFLSYLIYYAIRERQLFSPIVAVLGLGVMLSASWILFYQDLQGLLPYLRGIVEFSSGNSSAMTTNPQNNWILLISFAAIVVYLPFAVGQKKAFVFYSIFGLSVLAFLKYTFSREGFSLNYAFIYLLVVFLLFVLYVGPLLIKHYLLIAAALLFFGANMKYYGGGTPPIKYVAAQIKQNFDGRTPLIVLESLIHYQEHAAIVREVSEQRLSPQKLSERTRALIGRNRVDAYPYEISYVAANGFSYAPRPTVQSYIAYTPYLDSQNAKFFRSPQRAPEYLLWHAPLGDIQNNSIDARYVLNDEPLTIFEILGRYSPVLLDGPIVVYKNNGFQKFDVPRLTGATRSRWGEWTSVPAHSCDALRGRLHVSRTLVGTLKRLIYKEEEFYIEYKLDDTSTRKHRLVIDNAKSGVWVTPYVQNIWTPALLPVKEIKVSHSLWDFLKPEVRWDWECIKKVGDQRKTEAPRVHIVAEPEGGQG